MGMESPKPKDKREEIQLENLDIQLVIFDMDGLMIDTERLAMIAFSKTMEENGYEFDKALFLELIGVPILNMEQQLLKKYGSEFPFLEMMDCFRANRVKYMEQYGITAKKGLTELLEHLENKGIKKAVATSSVRSVMEKSLKDIGVFHYFEYSVCGDEVLIGKPNPEVFIKALSKASVKPENALVLEDSMNGIRASHNASIRPIFIQDLVPLANDVKDYIFMQMDDLSQVISLF